MPKLINGGKGANIRLIMEFGKNFNRRVTFEGDVISKVDIQVFTKSDLNKMGVKDFPSGVCAVGKNNEGLIIRLVEIKLTVEEKLRLAENKKRMVARAMNFLGVEH
jgi:hypothetical protein